MNITKKEELSKKGWTKREINKAETILGRSEHHDIFFSKIVLWSALLVIVIGNLMVSFVAIPFLVVLNKWVLYAVIVLLAGMIGFLYNLLINDIGHLEQKHHILASILVPVLAVINLVVIVFVSNNLIKDLKINNNLHNPWGLSILFAGVFILPFIVGQIRLYMKKKKSVNL